MTARYRIVKKSGTYITSLIFYYVEKSVEKRKFLFGPKYLAWEYEVAFRRLEDAEAFIEKALKPEVEPITPVVIREYP